MKASPRSMRCVLLAMCFVLVSSALACRRKQPPAPVVSPDAGQQIDAELIAANNRAVGLMGKFEFAAAREVFLDLAQQHPDRRDLQVNLAIATLNRQQEGDEQEALRLLDGVLQAQPDHMRAHYCTGLLKLYLDSPQEALPHFSAIALADPSDAYAAYYVGQCHAQLREYNKALEWYERAIAHDEYLRSAYYAAAQACRALRQEEKAQQFAQLFQSLERNPRARLVEFKYTRMGPKSQVIAIDAADPEPPQPRPEGPIFADAVPLLTNGEQFTWMVRRDDRPVSITACDINNDGHVDVFIANVLDDEGVFNAVCINKGGSPPTFALDADHILASIPDVNAALWGDYDNDGLTDVYLCRRGPNMLWRQSSGNVWNDVTAASGADHGDFDTVDGVMFDADHDGDLDIFCVNFDGPNELLINNLDGPPVTFRAIAQERGIAGSGEGSVQALPVDLDGDRDLDIIVINRNPPHNVWINDRLWQYRPGEFPELLNASIAHVASAEESLWTVDAFGHRRWWKFGNASMQSSPDAPANAQASTVGNMLIADVTGDGTLKMLIGSATGWHASALARAHIDSDFASNVGVRSLGMLVTPDSRGPSLIMMPVSGQPLIAHPGPGRQQFATLSFTGRREGESMRSNASGIGTHYAARIDSKWVIGSTLRNASGPGQSLQPVAIGLGGYDTIDFISIDWSDGVFQTEIELEAGKHHVITETQRQLSSCPVLFAWNGEKYEFISDVLGVGGLGYMISPSPPTYATPRPWENFMLPAGSLQPRDGRYILKLGEPMEEVCYLDAAQLIAYDLPTGWKMTLDERMNIAGPEPTGEPRFYREELLPFRAVNDRDENVSDAMLHVDLRAAPVGDLDHRFIGRLHSDHVLTLEFSEPIDGAGREPLLIIDGWVEYPYSQTMFAAWQANAEYRAPTIEAIDEHGNWHVVLEQFGYPAGMPRQMSVPLKNLPASTTRLRISTNQEIYFDRIAIAYAEPPPADVVRHEFPLHTAKLIQSGFAMRTTGSQRQPHYDYARRTPLWDTRYQRGNYTQLGEMTDLVREVDDAVAVFGPGEEIHMEFVAADVEHESQLQTGWTRVFVLKLNGWCKDMDLFTKDGETIDPLPLRHESGQPSPRREELHQRLNTRFQSGK